VRDGVADLLPTSGNEAVKRLQETVDSLKFTNIDNRFLMVKQAHMKTCRWLHDMPEYKQWANADLSSDDNFLWIKGKPGAGKSTLMKFAFSEAKKVARNAIMASFFFNARGVDLEKSTLGLYRSILYQLLQADRDARSTLENDSVVDGSQWSMEKLKDVLRSALKRVQNRQVVCYIDALDECDEDEIRDMISYFLDLTDETAKAGVHMRICLSSRHYPHITIRRGLSFKLERQKEHQEDIANYIASELAIGDGPYAEDIKQRVQEKASGVFMWIVLVVRILNKEFDKGNMLALQKRLDEIPSSLSELFLDMLTRDCEDLERLWICLQWVLFAKRPLTRQELYFAIIAGSDPTNLNPWNRQEISLPDMGRYILNCSKGLTELTKKTMTVQFIHESVRDFLLKENGLAKLWAQFADNFTGNSHDKLRQCCETQLMAVPGVNIEYPASRPWKSASVKNLFPFLQYAVDFVFHHANLAQEHGWQQDSFLSSFELGRWIILHNILEQYPVRHLTFNADMLYVLARQDASKLLSIHPDLQHHHDFPRRGERNRFPLFVALALGNMASVRVLLSVAMGAGPCECGVYSPHPNTYKKFEPGYNRDFGSFSDYYSLERVIRLNDRILLHALLRCGQFYDEGKNLRLLNFTANTNLDLYPLLFLHGFAPENAEDVNSALLFFAAKASQYSFFYLMLGSECPTPSDDAPVSREAVKLKAFLDTSATWDRSQPLKEAVYRNDTHLVKLLLDSDSADLPDDASEMGQDALRHAILAGKKEVVKLVLTYTHINPDEADRHGWTPLLLAISCSFADMVELLLSCDRIDPSRQTTVWPIDLFRPYHYGRLGREIIELLNMEYRKLTPLVCAVELRKRDMVKLLLTSSRVDPEHALCSGQSTPLEHAICYVDTELVNILLKSPRVNPDRSSRPLELAMDQLVRWSARVCMEYYLHLSLASEYRAYTAGT
jgi:ankyrin repeat protein